MLADFSELQNDVLLTICCSSVCPRHPFAREGEDNVAILEFGWHCNQKEISHPKECHPKYPEKKEVSSKRKTRIEGVEDVYFPRVFALVTP
jgi:hypothetical protein